MLKLLNESAVADLAKMVEAACCDVFVLLDDILRMVIETVYTLSQMMLRSHRIECNASHSLGMSRTLGGQAFVQSEDWDEVGINLPTFVVWLESDRKYRAQS